MDLEAIKTGIVTNVYHIRSDKKIALHKHTNHSEVFYCIKGEGFGMLENSEVTLTEGKVFIVSPGVMHSLRTDKDLLVSSFLIPSVSEDF